MSKLGSPILDSDTKQETNFVKMYKCLLINDDVSPMDLVVQILISIFNMEPQKAVEVMLEVHTTGVGLAGIFTQELAELKLAQAHSIARGRGYPLQVTMEPA